MTYEQAQRHAILSGATQSQIDAEARFQLRQPLRLRSHTVLALQLHPYSNTPNDWLRLAGALLAGRTHA